MSDTSGSVEATTSPRRPANEDTISEPGMNQPSLPLGQPVRDQQGGGAAAPVSWTPAIDKLQAVHDDAGFQKTQTELAKRAAKLLTDIGQGADLQDEQIRTRIAYLVADIDRATKANLGLPPELRSEIDVRAVSYPGLDHPDIQEMLRQTSSMEARDHQTIKNVRLLARDYVNQDPAGDAEGKNRVTAERIRAMGDRVLGVLAGPEAPPHAGIPEDIAAAATTPASGSQADQTRARTRQQQQTNQAQARQNAQPEAIRPAQVQQQEQQAPQPAGTINVRVPAATGILNRLTQGQGDGPPPWQGVAQALSDRLMHYREAQADRRHRDLERGVEVSGAVAVRALAALDTGQAADVMRKIGQEAAKDPNGATGVIEQMRPGGKHETLRNEFNAVFARDQGFGGVYDRAKVAMTDYLENRHALQENYHARGWRVEDLDDKLRHTDQAILSVAERTPGRNSGENFKEELAKKARELAEALYQKVSQMFGRLRSAVSPEAAASASPSPSMSPGP